MSSGGIVNDQDGSGSSEMKITHESAPKIPLIKDNGNTKGHHERNHSRDPKDKSRERSDNKRLENADGKERR